MECYDCGYPSGESAFIDRNPPWPCDTTKEKLIEFINEQDYEYFNKYNIFGNKGNK